MATRGPKPGWKKSQPEQSQALPGAQEAPGVVPSATVTVEPAPILSAADLENPSKLSGQQLQDLAWRRGLSRSSMEGMPDAKIREQLRYITQRQYEAA